MLDHRERGDSGGWSKTDKSDKSSSIGETQARSEGGAITGTPLSQFELLDFFSYSREFHLLRLPLGFLQARKADNSKAYRRANSTR